jgi:AMMECR1 domain-containing protein
MTTMIAEDDAKLSRRDRDAIAGIMATPLIDSELKFPIASSSYDAATTEASRELLYYARQKLFALFEEGADVPLPYAPMEIASERVNVTIRTNGTLRGSMSAEGPSLVDQLNRALVLAVSDTRFAGPIVRADLLNMTVELWLLISRVAIPIGIRQNSTSIRLGEEGIEVKQGSLGAYFKPSVAITKFIKTPQDLLCNVCRKAGLPSDAWMNEECEVWKTDWIHLCESPSRTSSVRRALRGKKATDITLPVIQRWIKAGSDYLFNNQQANGTVTYWYDPFNNVAGREPSNPVREAGCAYAFAAAASHLPDAALTRGARKAASALLTRIHRADDGALFISEDGRPGGKLGTTALTLLALQTPALAIPEFSSVTSELSDAIHRQQRPGGRFTCVFGDAIEAENHQDYFPGQALLTIVAGAKKGDPKSREAISQAFPHYRTRFQNAPATAFVGWHVDVWSRAFELEGRREFADFAFEQAEWLLQFQVPEDGFSLNSGGFETRNEPPGCSSITYTEALACVAALAFRLNDSRYPKFKLAFRRALLFCSQLWLTEDQSSFFPHPQRAVGGVVRSISNFMVRADMVQHAITLGLAACEAPFLFE